MGKERVNYSLMFLVHGTQMRMVFLLYQWPLLALQGDASRQADGHTRTQRHKKGLKFIRVSDISKGLVRTKYGFARKRLIAYD